MWSPFWTLHVQFCHEVRIYNISIFNPNNRSFSSSNGDGIDISSSTDVVVSDSTLDCSDDATAVRAGSGWAGSQQEPQMQQHVSRCRTEGVVIERIEYRNGHGLRCGEDAVGGIVNVTWRDIHVRGDGPVQVAHGAPGCVRLEAWPDDGGVWENITWERVKGEVGSNGVSWNENHPHAGAWPPLVPTIPGTSPPPNVSSWVSGRQPSISDITIKDIHLTKLQSNPRFLTLTGAAVEGLVLKNVTLVPKSRLEASWACKAMSPDGHQAPNRLCAVGSAEQISPPLLDGGGKYDCTFSPCSKGHR